jgi:CubicO group peptidase (beta-lactamase class C family)
MTRTLVALLVTLVTLLALPLPAAGPGAVKPEEVGLSSERLQRIARMIDRHITAGDLAGAVTIVGRRGKVAYQAAQGVADRDSKQPMTTASMFRIASMTKPIVGVAIMSLVEDGKLHLSDPIERYIPQFKNMKVAVPSSPGGTGAQGSSPPRYTTEPARRAITIKDLLTHVSGLGSGPNSLADIERVARKEGETLADYIPRLGSTVLEFQPGSRWTYSPGAGFETLGRIVEIASGERLDRFLRARIFDPLAMKDITFWPTDAQWPRVATVYRRDGGGLVKAQTPNDNSSRNVYFRGSGGLYSTAEDYIPFGLMLANGGELNGARVLGRKSVEMLAAVHAPDTLPGRPPGEGYGLSVRVVTNHAAAGTFLSDGTYGWSGAQGTHFFVDPKEQLVGVLMVQTSNAELRREFEDLVAQSVVD